MIAEADLHTCADALDDFRDPQAEMALAAIRAGNSRARFWRMLGGACLLWDQANNIFYLAGPPPDEQLARQLAGWVVDGLRPLALAERRARFSLLILRPGWEGLLPVLFRGVAFVERRKRFYRFQQDQALDGQHAAGEEVDIVDIDAALLARDGLQGLPGLRAEIEWMWPSLDRFVQHGFGKAAVKQERILCWCTSEYVSETMCGIGIETIPEFERQGLATAVASAFVRCALERGIRPHWECDEQNLPSVRVAEKVGFDLLKTSPAWVGRFV